MRDKQFFARIKFTVRGVDDDFNLVDAGVYARYVWRGGQEAYNGKLYADTTEEVSVFASEEDLEGEGLKERGD